MIEPPSGKADFHRALLPLLIVDLAFITTHVLLRVALWNGADIDDAIVRPLSITADRSLPEIYGCGKWLTVAIVLARSYRQTRIPLYAAFAVIFGVLLADDLLRIHEQGGRAVVGALHLEEALGLRAQDIAELAVWSGLGVIVVACGVTGLRRTARADRAFAPFLVGTLCALIVAGVGIDMLHSLTARADLGSDKFQWLQNLFFGVAEDGGEMILGSLAVGYAMAIRAGSRTRRGEAIAAVPAAAAIDPLWKRGAPGA